MLYRDGRKADDIHKGKWNGLGGKIEKGESPEDAVKREILEESGLIISSPTLRGHIVFPDFNNGEDFFMFIFTTKQYQGQLIKDCPEGELQWVNNEDIPMLNMWEGDYYFFDWLKKEKFFSAKMNYKEGRYLKHEIFFY